VRDTFTFNVATAHAHYTRLAALVDSG